MKKRKQSQREKQDSIMAQAIFIFYVNMCGIYWHKMKNELLKLAKTPCSQEMHLEMLYCAKQFEAMALKDYQVNCQDKQGNIPLASFVKLLKSRTYHWAWMWNKIGYWHGLAKGGNVPLVLQDMKNMLQSLTSGQSELTQAANAAFNRGKEAMAEAQGDHAAGYAAEFDLGRELEQKNPKWGEVYALMNHNPHITESEMASDLGISQPSVHSRLENLRKWLAQHHPGMTLPGDYARRKPKAPSRSRKTVPLQESDAPTIPDPDHGGPELPPF